MNFDEIGIREDHETFIGNDKNNLKVTHKFKSIPLDQQQHISLYVAKETKDKKHFFKD